MITLTQPAGYEILFRGNLNTVDEIKTTDKGSIVSITLFRPMLWYSYTTFFNDLEDRFFQLTVPDEEAVLLKDGQRVTHIKPAA